MWFCYLFLIASEVRARFILNVLSNYPSQTVFLFKLLTEIVCSWNRKIVRSSLTAESCANKHESWNIEMAQEIVDAEIWNRKHGTEFLQQFVFSLKYCAYCCLTGNRDNETQIECISPVPNITFIIRICCIPILQVLVHPSLNKLTEQSALFIKPGQLIVVLGLWGSLTAAKW